MRKTYQDLLDRTSIDGYYDAHTGGLVISIFGSDDEIIISDPETVRELRGRSDTDVWVVGRVDAFGGLVSDQLELKSVDEVIEALKELMK